MRRTKQDLANYIRNRTGRDPILYGSGGSLRKDDLRALADEMGVDYSGGDTAAEIRAAIARDGLGRDGTTAVDVDGGFEKIDLSRIASELRDDE